MFVMMNGSGDCGIDTVAVGSKAKLQDANRVKGRTLVRLILVTHHDTRPAKKGHTVIPKINAERCLIVAQCDKVGAIQEGVDGRQMVSKAVSLIIFPRGSRGNLLLVSIKIGECGDGPFDIL